MEELKIEPDKETIYALNADIFKNLLMAIGIMLYFYFLNLGYINIEKSVFTTDLKVFSFAWLAATIILFEIAYKKDNGKLAIFGIESLFLTLITMYLIQIYFYLNPNFRLIPLLLPFAFSIYYIVKSIVMYVKGNKKYIKDLSDIKEIVKKGEEI